MNEKRFKKIVKEYLYWETEKTREEIKEEAEGWKSEAWFIRLEHKIETIKLLNDVAYIFIETILYPDGEIGRYLETWVFKKNNWYRKDICLLHKDACKDFPIIFSNVQIERINFTTVRISWETDEEVEAEIRYWNYEEYKRPIKKVSLPGLKKKHEGTLSDLYYDALYYFKPWAVKDNKSCHSNEIAYQTGGEDDWRSRSDGFIIKLILSTKNAEETLQQIDNDLARGSESNLLEVDGEIAQKIANESGYAFSYGVSKSQEVYLDAEIFRSEMDPISLKILEEKNGKYLISEESEIKIVAPETKETIEKAEKMCPDCKNKKTIIYYGTCFWGRPTLFFYANSYYDYIIQIPRYFVERASLSEIGKKYGLTIEREEDVIEWLRKKDRKK